MKQKWHRCGLCGHRTPLPPECRAVVALAISQANVVAVWDAEMGTLLHDCRHVRIMDDAHASDR